ncbi:MAG: tetratricopeptide repeat protein [Candidatus Omnitrophica bacterium]|nr:tetratricopeptide repeat protein [Candidatus Omnitrophota bacterium]
MRKHIIWIVILICLVYANSLTGNFVYDDYLVIVNNTFIKSTDNLKLFFNSRYLTHPLEAAFNEGAYNIGSGESSYRPVATLSYFLNYAIFKLDPFGYRLVNIAIHILCAVFIYLLFNRVFSRPRLALFAALIFGLHPVNAEVVNCTAFRSNSLALLFCLLTIILYFRSKAKTGKYRYLYLSASLFSASLAFFSKETALILPLALILCDYYSFNFDLSGLLKRWRIYFLYFLVGAICIFIYFAIMPPKQHIFNVFPAYGNLMRMFAVTGLYLKAVLYPADLALIDTTEIYHSGFVLILGIGAFVLAAYVLLKIRKFPPEASFGIIWFFLWMLPMNNFINSFRIPAAYRYLYVAMPGFALVLGLILSKIERSCVKMPVLQRLAPFACLGYFAIFTVSTNATWKNDIILNMSVVEKNPKSLYAHLNWGNALLKYGNLGEARDELSSALSRPDLHKCNPSEVSLAYSNLGYIYLTENEYAKAEEAYRHALRLTPNLAHLHTQLGICYARQGLYEKALDYFNKAKMINPSYAPAYVRTAKVYMSLRKYAQAEIEFNKALEIYPDYQPAEDGLKELEKLQKEAGK